MDSITPTNYTMEGQPQNIDQLVIVTTPFHDPLMSEFYDKVKTVTI